MQPEHWIGRPITDREGRPYGSLDELFVGRATGEPEFGIVSVGRAEGAGDKRVAVPLAGARVEGDVVVLPLDPDRVRAAPEVQRTVDDIPPEAGERIYAYFGHGAEPTTAMPPTAAAAPEPVPLNGAPPVDVEAVEEAEVTVSEEELVVDKEAVVTGRVRLRKVIVEEEVSVTVTLRREELRIEREPIAPDDPTDLRRGAGDEQLVEGELEFVLLAEEPVVEKRVVPVERIKVARDTIVEQRRIVDEVRKERIDVDEHAAGEPPPAL